MKEVWKHFDRENFPNHVVSNLGRIKRLSHTKDCKTRSGKMSPRKYPEIIISLIKKKNGYLATNIVNKDGELKDMLAHRMVAMAFLSNPEEKRCVNHINSNRSDNRVVNLEWATHSENVLHGYMFGNIKPTDYRNHGNMRTCKYKIVAARRERGEG